MTVTPAPDGTIQIASDVIVVGGVAAYNADGSRFAFTARPADGSAGPDVYVWDTSDTQARAVTTGGRSIFAGWDGSDLLVSRVVDDRPHTLAVNPRSGVEKDEHGNDAWLPGRGTRRQARRVVGRQASGSPRTASPGFPTRAGWSSAPGRTARTTPRCSTAAPAAAWDVRWAPDGKVVAVWTDRDRTPAMPGA